MQTSIRATRASTLWLIDRGIRVMGIDAWGWDRPFGLMVEELKRGVKGRVWEAHYAGKEKEYCHIENLANLDMIPKPFGFKVAVFPIKIERASAGWCRAVARVIGTGAGSPAPWIFCFLLAAFAPAIGSILITVDLGNLTVVSGVEALGHAQHDAGAPVEEHSESASPSSTVTNSLPFQ